MATPFSRPRQQIRQQLGPTGADERRPQPATPEYPNPSLSRPGRPLNPQPAGGAYTAVAC